MNFKDYQEAAARTAAQDSDPVKAVCAYAMGLAGESGELVDMLKKDVFHGVPMTLAQLESEAGDVLWYLSNLCRIHGVDLQHVAENNLMKLKRRYPDGFVKGGGIRE
jgi:NTP pyrophosphatase (non-canonical NTP hydrolase)